jgi:hypothetical protein
MAIPARYWMLALAAPTPPDPRFERERLDQLTRGMPLETATFTERTRQRTLRQDLLAAAPAAR